jgi:Fe-S cluster assembly protein SufD
MLDVFLDENSRAHLDKFIAIEGSYYGFCTERIYQQKNSYCALQTITLNTHFTRNDLEVYSQGEGTHTQLYGAFFGTQQQLVDNHTFMHHLSPNCTSDEKYKGVLKDKATGVFNGKVKVYKDAQKINAFQSNRNLLLSDAATMNSKPELEIYADDVKCSHGCTTGQIDPTALYYLRARGISKEKAQEMLIKAFITDVVEAVKSENIKGKITKWLGAEI